LHKNLVINWLTVNDTDDSILEPVTHVETSASKYKVVAGSDQALT